MRKIIAVCMALLLMAGAVTGCSEKTTAPSDDEASSQAEDAGDELEPVTVTMFGHWLDKGSSGQFNSFKAALAKEYPEITLDYEAFPTGELPYTDELTRRAEHNKMADITLTMNTELGGSGKLMDLTKQEFTGRYSIAAMKQISVDGAVYFLPGAGNAQCYVYNEIQLKEMGLEPPETLNELEEIMGAISAGGGHPFLVPFEQTKSLYIKALAAGYLATPEGQLWLEDYNKGEAAMKGNAHWEEAWRRAQRMVEAGYITKEDALFAEGRRITEMSQGKGAISMVSSSFSTMFYEMIDNNYKFTLLPILGEKPENKTVFSVPSCYFAAAGYLDLPENRAKREAVLKIFNFISTEAGQAAIRGEAPLSSSYLSNVQLEMDTRAAAVTEVLKTGSFGPAPVFERGVEDTLGEAFGSMINGLMTAEQAMGACDRQNASYTAGEPPAVPVVLGKASEEFPWVYNTSRSQELAVTNFVADSIKEALGTEIALELGTAVRGEFFEGDITDNDIKSVIRMDKKLYKVQVTGRQIWDLIDQGVKIKNSSWFVVVSGLKYSYRPAKGEAEGELLTLTTADGTPIDLDKTYEAAVSDNQMSEVTDTYTFFGTPCEDVGIMLRNAVTKNIQRQGTISPALEGRIKTV